MKKPIKRVSFVDSFALLEIDDWMEIPAKERTETAVRKAACIYSSTNDVILSVSFDRRRLVSIVKRLQ